MLQFSLIDRLFHEEGIRVLNMSCLGADHEWGKIVSACCHGVCCLISQRYNEIIIYNIYYDIKKLYRIRRTTKKSAVAYYYL